MGNLLLGVSGGIAAYKAVEVARLAGKAGHAVRVIQTPDSLRFVGRPTFEAVTGAPVLVDAFEADAARGRFPGEAEASHDPIAHLELAQRCDAFAIAPASANTIAKLAAGLADNMLTTAALAARLPLVIAPAMNDAMWDHAATSANVATLVARGALLVPPETGALASRGEWGSGRLAEPARILAEIERAMAARVAPAPLAGLHVLVTAGGTREPLDAVRYVGNRSSGRMGVALAAEAARRGAQVTLVGANLAVEAPAGVRLIAVETAEELGRAASEAFLSADVLLMAAAVSDFRPSAAAAGKLAKSGREGLTLELQPTADVLAGLSARRRPDQTLVGFAAEHGDGALSRARGKLTRKGLDLVVMNDVAEPGIGFDAADNAVVLVGHGEERTLARAPKPAIAAAILDRVELLRGADVPAAALSGAPR